MTHPRPARSLQRRCVRKPAAGTASTIGYGRSVMLSPAAGAIVLPRARPDAKRTPTAARDAASGGTTTPQPRNSINRSSSILMRVCRSGSRAISGSNSRTRDPDHRPDGCSTRGCPSWRPSPRPRFVSCPRCPRTGPVRRAAASWRWPRHPSSRSSAASADPSRQSPGDHDHLRRAACCSPSGTSCAVVPSACAGHSFGGWRQGWSGRFGRDATGVRSGIAEPSHRPRAGR